MRTRLPWILAASKRSIATVTDTGDHFCLSGVIAFSLGVVHLIPLCLVNVVRCERGRNMLT